ncbi:SRPBCC domain-containing protein [Chitinophaga sp. Cy-1792]|uniref:SRPBCC domain-containing protein n=1 Tax=Chitinophaga sp. Cy-1792 TaxID=2608339 RepID=UPI0014212C3A|nr:SRPBCC domain-containing protein [Chitinophaga sp. Cy-1792]NIG56721.1 ATPase [Chitinophaga sp. Cy-1792]
MITNISKITINADPQRVWNVLTQPALVKQWQYNSDLHTDWQVGSTIEFVSKWEDQVFKQWGKVLAFDPPHQLAYSLFAPRPGLENKPENYFVMKYILAAANGQTKLEIRMEDSRPGAVQEPEQGEESPVLQALKQLAESE